MKRWARHTLLIMLAITILSFAYADFPYSAEWLNYADMRIVYQIDTSAVTSNTADVYATIDLNATLIQEYIQRWSDYCDPINRYDWFYPTFTYASTANQTERPLQVVSYQNWQTFAVGACGDVNLPTRFIVKLPNGILDGGVNYALYQHYIYAYLKYPFVEDFYDDQVGFAPAGWEPETNSDTSAVVFIGNYNSIFDRGHALQGVVTLYRNISTSINLDDTTPAYVCSYSDAYHIVSFLINGQWHSVANISPYLHSCIDVKQVLRKEGLSGTVTVQRIKLYVGISQIFWLWIVPDSVYRIIISS